ncbi:triphosphoribosyl-dephospho-CoA synthase [Fictibacillus fluitans]|uniref:triphosphoribosyl-dephospho-CoA synthase n=1 Tax=Fictibacillus fluitans TaxID=3058422 RepID=A0ABT8HYU0_9BACL|nr:triphosphoribosyl-dephospho-CoA synthase [Fictibacillus sp. NE201]MDN4525945.1 triphosphoribosyl-dephospho-CoA synthase [Fictibacillus sp. NE201]
MDQKRRMAETLAELAVQTLVDEVNLTPKPGLVDQENNGAHHDLTIELMRRSAVSLRPVFTKIAESSYEREPSQSLREDIAVIGRKGEQVMLGVTGGINTHKGAIWSLGLLVSAAAGNAELSNTEGVAERAGRIARFQDRYCPVASTNGSKVKDVYQVPGARGEAQLNFPHVCNIGLPFLQQARRNGIPETNARLDVLLAIMSELDDTCILHRGGMEALQAVKNGANEVLKSGGTSTNAGRLALIRLDETMMELFVSPGGSADLLAAVLFLDALQKERSLKGGVAVGNVTF